VTDTELPLGGNVYRWHKRNKAEKQKGPNRMSKLSRALTELQMIRSFASQVADSSLRANLLAKVNEVERLVKSVKRES
jgi:replicative DNA helicase